MVDFASFEQRESAVAGFTPTQNSQRTKAVATQHARAGTTSGHRHIGYCVFRAVRGVFAHLLAIRMTYFKQRTKLLFDVAAGTIARIWLYTTFISHLVICRGSLVGLKLLQCGARLRTYIHDYISMQARPVSGQPGTNGIGKMRNVVYRQTANACKVKARTSQFVDVNNLSQLELQPVALGCTTFD
eukprot:4930880-Pleurochrysis_carterae.AAC.2